MAALAEFESMQAKAFAASLAVTTLQDAYLKQGSGQLPNGEAVDDMGAYSNKGPSPEAASLISQASALQDSLDQEIQVLGASRWPCLLFSCVLGHPMAGLERMPSACSKQMAAPTHLQMRVKGVCTFIARTRGL